MKTIICLMLFFSLAVLMISCEDVKEPVNNPQLSGQLIHHSPCKSGLKSAGLVGNTPDSLSCVDYFFDKINNKLILKHFNAGFNCCPDSLYCQVSLKGDTIFIREFEAASQCRCNCLYDLELEIKGIEDRNYRIVLDEPYAGELPSLDFNIDLSKDNSGSFCVTRKQYPWGMENI